MNHDQDPQHPGWERAREALRGLRPESPDPEFRSRMEDLFLTQQPERPAVRGTRFRRTAAIAAASILLVTGVWVAMANRGSHWSVAAVRGSGSVTIAGQTYSSDDRAAWERLLSPGTAITVDPAVEIDLVQGEFAWVTITGGSSVTAPDIPGRWWGRDVDMALVAGEVRVSTGPAFPGASLNIHSPEGQAAVRGTTCAVFRTAEGTCVCLLEGSLRFVPHTSTDVTLPAGGRHFHFLDGRPPEDDALKPMERMKLEMLRDAARARWPATPR